MQSLIDKKYFYFTQQSLKTFCDCPYKFKKKYIDNIKWDTDDDFAEKIDFGIEFHEIAERYFKDIPIFEESFKDNTRLFNAYQNLKEYFKKDTQNKYFSEYSIRFSDGFIRLEANIDLIIIKPDNSIEIWDFKTSADKSKANTYIKSLQTDVYMYTLKKTMQKIFGFSTNYDKIKMIYFNPENKEEIAIINYTEALFGKQEKNINSIINKIYNYDYKEFARDEHKKACSFCEFNLFCDNKKVENEFSLDLTWDEIEEVQI